MEMNSILVNVRVKQQLRLGQHHFVWDTLALEQNILSTESRGVTRVGLTAYCNKNGFNSLADCAVRNF